MPNTGGRQMYGRRIILSGEREINEGNVAEVLQKALNIHRANRSEIQYLWDYYRGKQPILSRTKEVRSDICNKVVENRANEIVSFKVGYLCGEPIQYVGRSGDDRVTEAITRLNELMFSEDKVSQDQEIVEWQMICGTAYRLVLPDADEPDSAPFELYTLDPRDTFVVYSNSVGHPPLMGVTYTRDEQGVTRYSVYTENRYYELVDGRLDAGKTEAHALDCVPIFEYPANNARQGAFEIVLPLLDAINNVESNRLDGVEQFVQAYWKFIGCKISPEEYEEFLRRGAIMIPPNDGGGNIDVDLVVKELSQAQTQTLKDDLYTAVLTVCGMPNRNGGSSTSDTGAAVLLRDGWSLAEARAKDSEHIFRRSEKKMLKLVLRLCRDLAGLELELKDIDLQFTRRNYDNIQSKAQVLDIMLKNPKIHPLLAFQSAGLFVDPESAYSLSMKYADGVKEAETAELMAAARGE